MGRSKVPKSRSEKPGTRSLVSDRSGLEVTKALRGVFSGSESTGLTTGPPGGRSMVVTEIFKFLYQRGVGEFAKTRERDCP